MVDADTKFTREAGLGLAGLHVQDEGSAEGTLGTCLIKLANFRWTWRSLIH